jgi:16S rRNA (cytidine1402-2'-O)-methyltransferase
MGTLYLVATPVGNLEDITLRALNTLKKVDLIACEDTRQTAKLLTRFGISTPRKSYHKFNEKNRTGQLIQMLREGKNIALVSDSGTPLVSDPGYELVTSCRREGIPVIPIPGPSAVMAALIGSGLPADSFFFAGFLPSRKTPRQRRLRELADIPATLILFEAPHRLLASLEDMIAVFGDRKATIARELTKVHEEFLQGTLEEILTILQSRPKIQGEITVVVERGYPTAHTMDYPPSLKQHLEAEMEKTGLARNDALKSVAKQRGITRKQAYNQLNCELRIANYE